MPRTIAPTIIPPFCGTCQPPAKQSSGPASRATGYAGAIATTCFVQQPGCFGAAGLLDNSLAPPAALAGSPSLQQSIRLVHYLHHGSTSAEFF